MGSVHTHYLFPSMIGLIGNIAFVNLLAQLDFLEHSTQVRFELIRQFLMNSNIRFVPWSFTEPTRSVLDSWLTTHPP